MASPHAHGLNLALRWFVRRRWSGPIDVAKVRAVGARLDRWMARSASSQSGRAMTAHGVPCESFDPTVANPALLYLHGGGFVARHISVVRPTTQARVAATA